jgi:arginine deiminase
MHANIARAHSIILKISGIAPMWTVKSEYGKLKKVLIHDAKYNIIDISSFSPQLFFYDSEKPSTVQFKELEDILKKYKVEVFELSNII